LTQSPQETERVAQAQANGEAIEAQIAAHGEAMLGMPGGGVDVSAAMASPEDGAVPWFGTSSIQPAVAPPQTHSPNVSDPLDNSQSQG
jgi:hypothetical protein